MSITQTISSLGTPPSTSDPSTFATRADALLGTELPDLVAEINTWAGQANALAAALNSIAAGGAMAMPYIFSTTTTDADPTPGYLRLDNATQNTATTIRLDLVDSDGSTQTASINTFDDSTSTVKGYIRLIKASDATAFIKFSVSALASPSGYKNITVAVVDSSAANPFTNNDPVILYFTPNGDKGDTGTNGTNGKNAGFAYTYSNNTSATDPTSGKLKFDNTTLGSATKLYISETDSDTNGIAAEIATWDDSTSTVKGTLKVAKSTDPTKFAIFQITSSLTDNGTWDTFNLTYITGAGSLTDGDAVTVNFYQTGDKGGDGASGGLVLLATLTPTAAANVDALNTFTSSYDNYLIIGNGLLPAADDTLALRFAVAGAADSGSNYYERLAENSTAVTSATTKIALASPVYSSGKGCSFVIHITNANDATNNKSAIGKASFQTNSTPGYIMNGAHGVYIAANAVSGVRFFWVSGNNFSAVGKIRIFGYNNS